MKIALLGYGKMGKTIEQMARDKGHEIGLRIDQQEAGQWGHAELRDIDVAIEFSRPEAAYDNIRTALLAGTPVVSGTTGWLDRMADIQALCDAQSGAFFYASNFSIGVNLFFALNQKLAQLMNAFPQYAVEMEEIHHTEKLDAPSGTAITLAQGIIERLDRKADWVSHASARPETLAIHSKRIDRVPGTHRVQYGSPIDQITIEHVAHSREGFARGALLAAEWLPGKRGNFGMNDLLQNL